MHHQYSRRTALTTGMLAASGAALGFQRPAQADNDPEAESKWIIQFAAWKIKEGQEEKALGMIEKLTQAVEANEPGVLAYVAHRHAEEPNKVVFYEVFDSEETVKTHGAEPHLQEFIQGFSEAFEGPLEITRLNKVGGFTR